MRYSKSSFKTIYHENRTPKNKSFLKRYKQFKVMTENPDFVKWVRRNGEFITLQNKVVLRELNFDYDEQKPGQIGRILNNMITDLFSDLEEVTFTDIKDVNDFIEPQQKFRMRILVQLYMFWLGPLNRPHPELFAPKPSAREFG